MGIQQRTEKPSPPPTQGIWLWRPVGFDYRTSRELGKQTLGGHKQNLVRPRSQDKNSVPTGDWARFACECPGVSGRELTCEAVTLSEIWNKIDSIVLSYPEFHIKRTCSFALLNLRAFSAKNECKMGSFKAYHHLLCLSVEKDKVGAGNE